MTTTTQTERTGPAGLELRIAPDSYNPETRDFEVVMSTGAAVRRFSWVRGAYDEVLSLKPEHIRLDRINSGRAPFVEEHRHLSLDATIGTIAEGSVEIRGGELVGRVRMHETPRAVEMQERMARGELTSVSLGYRTYEQEVVESDEGPDTRTAIDWEPFELSLTPMPADNGAHTRSGELESFECVIRSRTETLMPEPNDDETPEPKSPKKRSAPEPAESNPKQRSAPAAPEPTGAAPEPNLDAERRGAEAERKRSAEIRKLTRTCRLEDSVSEDLIARGISLEQAREEILEKWNERHGGDEVHSHVRVGEEAASKRGAAIERVLLARFDARRYALKDDDDARQMSGDSLMEMGARHLAELGVNLVSIGSKSERADRMLALRAGYHTSTDFGVILGNVTGRILRDSYRTARRSFEPLARTRTVPDFKPITSVQLGPFSQLEKVPEGGEYSYGTAGESKETYRVYKYGRVVAITREALMNDDLDAFTRVPEKMGQQVALLENRMFWDILADNAPMDDGLPLFHVDHGNIITEALDMEALSAATTAMRLQTDIDGVTEIEVMPSFVAVPVELEKTARQLLVLQTVPNRTEEANPYQGELTPISSRYLSAASATEWYLFASPSEIDTIEIAYIAGNREPHFATREGFNVDGLEVKIRHEVGMKALDWRGIVKSTGQS